MLGEVGCADLRDRGWIEAAMGRWRFGREDEVKLRRQGHYQVQLGNEGASKSLRMRIL